MKKVNNIELMAPAGNFEAFQAALDAGADSIYFGVEQLNMRARATMNFTIEDLEEVVARAEPKGVRTYITLNTIVYDHDISIAKRIIDEAKRVGITAVIASDQAILMYAHTVGIEIHISTQLNITNVDTVKFYSNFADVMVLSRELSLRQIKAITDAIEKEQIKGPSGELVQVEIFAHGALCVAVSGKCYMSLHTQNASANRGACIQNCRRSYKVIDNDTGDELVVDNEYIMSPEDLCTLDFMDQVIDAGVCVLKIEGRGKAADYVHTVIGCYREAIDAYLDGTYTPEKVAVLMEKLKTVYNRGFWGGYYLGQELGSFSNTPGSKATEKKLFLGKGLHYYPTPEIGEFKIETHDLKIGDKFLITGPTTGVAEGVIDEIRVDGALVEKASKGQNCTFKVNKKIRPSDKLYKMIPND